MPVPSMAPVRSPAPSRRTSAGTATVLQLLNFHINRFGKRPAGVDEAGRGPLAGPVMAAAVILDPRRRIAGLADSKLLTPAVRAVLEARIKERAIAWAVAGAGIEEIDALNILQASLLAMHRAVAALNPTPDFLLIDGLHCPEAECMSLAVVKGDQSILPICAASILAKEARDREMCALDAVYPGYGFARHKGYATPEHLVALQRLGASPAHRRSFAPVKACL